MANVPNARRNRRSKQLQRKNRKRLKPAPRRVKSAPNVAIVRRAIVAVASAARVPSAPP